MVVVDDIKNELYTINNDCWYDNVSAILELLDFPAIFDYACLWEEFLYVRSEKMRAVNAKERKILSECMTIVHFKMERKYKGINVFAIRIASSNNSRNDLVYDLTNLFRRLYGRFTILVFVNGDELAFSGISVNQNKKTEVIISEWFGFDCERDKIEKILEIDFSSFTGKSLNQIYNNYLWAISRVYVRYRESKMFLIYGCDNAVTYEAFVPGQDGEGTILTTKIDREETLKINEAYYPDLYGQDFFVDDSGIEIESSDFYEDADDIEFEWTMLEMELAEEAEEDDFENFFDEEEDDSELYEFDEELKGMNPEEMLKYIRGE